MEDAPFESANLELRFPFSSGHIKDGDDVECLANHVFPHLKQNDVQAVIEYYESADGSWIDPYIDGLYTAAELSYEDHKRRWEAGEFGVRRFGSDSPNGSNE